MTSKKMRQYLQRKRYRETMVMSPELKEFLRGQERNKDTLYIYCDSSLRSDKGKMAVACCYLYKNYVIVKHQYVQPPMQCKDKVIFGELSAIIFGLTFFEKHMQVGCKKVVLYSDISYIEAIMNKESKFKKRNETLRKLQEKLIDLYNEKKQLCRDVAIEIEYLPKHLKKNNPYHRAAHNSARLLVSGESQ